MQDGRYYRSSPYHSCTVLYLCIFSYYSRTAKVRTSSDIHTVAVFPWSQPVPRRKDAIGLPDDDVWNDCARPSLSMYTNSKMPLYTVLVS